MNTPRHHARFSGIAAGIPILVLLAGCSNDHSSAQEGCENLRDLTSQLKSPQDLMNQRPGIANVLNTIVKSPSSSTADQLIIAAGADVRDVLSSDPGDPTYGDAWPDAMEHALGNLYGACADAGYIEYQQ